MFPIRVNFQRRKAESRTVLGGVLGRSVLKDAKQWTGETSQLVMKMKAAGFSETSLYFSHTTRRHVSSTTVFIVFLVQVFPRVLCEFLY